ncbi:hypothetical protein LT679_03630 [Mucilaginibacter roseus]|uniref:Uncharacterized protein n=1 Tax=Mucilaginibacter roseus TaxID=1528868 RepID=A0ABS8TXT0_9SPHI|nr:hypothetical protein [Mucilaginibacter roseus]MCD8739684.1 hypothetical protein [Mucilaginibacter roseus]
MSHVAYDFLADSLFFNEYSLSKEFKNESKQRIEKELIDYRNYVLTNFDRLKIEVNASQSALNVFTSAQYTSLDLLKQTALYMNQYIVADPLFRYTNLDTATEKAMSESLGFPEKQNLDGLTKAARYLKTLTPMVAGNYVKVFPVTYHFEPPKELPYKIPVNNNNDLLPQNIMQFFRERCVVSPMSKIEGGGWAILDGKPLTPTRAINIEFDGDRFNNGFIYFLTERKVLSYDEATGMAQIAQYMPPTEPEKDIFEAWVTQSQNSCAKAYFDQSFGEVYLAGELNAKYISENSLKHELLTMNLDNHKDISTFTAEQLLNIELPFLDKIDTAKLMQVRENDADVFTNFRLELEKQFREVRILTDPKDVKLKTESIFHELNEVQAAKIKQKVQYIHKQMFLNSVLTAGGLVGSMTVGGISLVGLGLALSKGYKDYRDYTQSVRENPAFFLWKSKL